MKKLLAACLAVAFSTFSLNAEEKANDRLTHLLQAADHLEAAGAKKEADSIREHVEALKKASQKAAPAKEKTAPPAKKASKGKSAKLDRDQENAIVAAKTSDSAKDQKTSKPVQVAIAEKAPEKAKATPAPCCPPADARGKALAGKAQPKGDCEACGKCDKDKCAETCGDKCDKNCSAKSCCGKDGECCKKATATPKKKDHGHDHPTKAVSAAVTPPTKTKSCCGKNAECCKSGTCEKGAKSAKTTEKTQNAPAKASAGASCETEAKANSCGSDCADCADAMKRIEALEKAVEALLKKQ